MPKDKKDAYNGYNYTGFCIRSLRREKGESQKDLAKQLNKSESAVRMWELGRSEPDIETLKLLARHFGVSVSYIIDERYTATLPENDDLCEYERRLITAYRERPEMHDAINMLLGMNTEDYARLYLAARSISNKTDRIEYRKKDEWENIKAIPETDDPLL